MYLFTVKNKSGAVTKITAPNEDLAKTVAVAAGHARTKENVRITRVQAIDVRCSGTTHIHNSGGKPNKKTFVVVDVTGQHYHYPISVIAGKEY